MTELVRPDICVIGAGAGGGAVARLAAAQDASVVLIERHRLGGEHIHTGCVPSKALLAAATRASTIRGSGRFGLSAQRFSAPYAAVSLHLRHVLRSVAQNHSHAHFASLGASVIEGSARFIDDETVAVDDLRIKARRFVIATGSSPILPDIPGLIGTPHFTNETVFDLAECPRHLIVLGAGTVGMELAQAFRRLGAEVTVLEAATPLADYDRECVDIILNAFTREGVRLRTGVEIIRVDRARARVSVDIAAPGGSETIEGSHLLIAAGRRPNVEGLELEAAGVRYGPSGIAVDERLSTSNKRISAVGDVTGGPGFTHAAAWQAAVVIRNALMRQPVKLSDRPVPWVIYTDPELAHVGLREEEARTVSKTARIIRWPYRENDRAQIEHATAGHMKIIADADGDILGATIVGASAAENIALWTLAVGQKLNIRAMAELVVPYPTYAEVGKRAANAYFDSGLTSVQTRRIMGWLRRPR